MLKQLIVKELNPSLRDDFLLFFDTVAFADNPDWSDCYCSAYHFTNNKGKTEARRESSNLIEEDRMHGFLAYDNGKPVGWCNATSRSSYPGVQWLMGSRPRQGRASRLHSLLRNCLFAPQTGSRVPALERCMHKVLRERLGVC